MQAHAAWRTGNSVTRDAVAAALRHASRWQRARATRPADFLVVAESAYKGGARHLMRWWRLSTLTAPARQDAYLRASAYAYRALLQGNVVLRTSAGVSSLSAFKVQFNRGF